MLVDNLKLWLFALIPVSSFCAVDIFITTSNILNQHRQDLIPARDIPVIPQTFDLVPLNASKSCDYFWLTHFACVFLSNKIADVHSTIRRFRHYVGISLGCRVGFLDWFHSTPFRTNTALTQYLIQITFKRAAVTPPNT